MEFLSTLNGALTLVLFLRSIFRSSTDRCKEWLRKHAPEHFPDMFPDEIAARLEAVRIAEESGNAVVMPGADEEEDEDAVKVAVPIEQKTSGGKKKKAAAEIVLMLGQRKGKKQVTIVYGLDLFGIKLKEAAKAAKRKFATGSSITVVCYSSSPKRFDGYPCTGSGIAGGELTFFAMPLFRCIIFFWYECVVGR